MTIPLDERARTLETSVALIVSDDDVWLARCKALCLSLGVARAYPFVGVEDMARRAKNWPIQFVIANGMDGVERVRDTVGLVRGHRDAEVRFSPVVVLSKDTSSAAIQPFLSMGCDDIVSFPTPRGQFVHRLALQIGRPLDYYETEAYFGPDRRRLLAPGSAEAGGRGEGGPVTHIIVQRDPRLGVRILSREDETGRRRKAG